MRRTYNFLINQNNNQISIKKLLENWLIPKRIRGTLRQNKRIFVNLEHVSIDYQLKFNDQLTFELDDQDFSYQQIYPSSIPSYDFERTICFENEDVLIVDKPANIKVHPHSPGENDTLLNFANNYFLQKKVISRHQIARAQMIHRLDRQTSGLIMIGKNPLASSIANQMLASKKIQRSYYAVLEGLLSQNAGIVDLPIALNDNDSRRRKIDPVDGQKAVSNWTRLNSNNQTTLVEFKLDTGRMHQIRIHAKSLGTPILGDDLYGNGDYQQRLMLHSSSIEFFEFFGGDKKIIKSVTPTEFYI